MRGGPETAQVQAVAVRLEEGFRGRAHTTWPGWMWDEGQVGPACRSFRCRVKLLPHLFKCRKPHRFYSQS